MSIHMRQLLGLYSIRTKVPCEPSMRDDVSTYLDVLRILGQGEGFDT